MPVLRPLGLAFAAIAALAACQQEDATLLAPGANAPGALDAARAACVEAGGTFEPAPGGGVELCVRTPPDANQPCTTANDCEGFCLARSRTCAPVVPLMGCTDVLLSNGTEANVCVN